MVVMILGKKQTHQLGWACTSSPELCVCGTMGLKKEFSTHRVKGMTLRRWPSIVSKITRYCRCVCVCVCASVCVCVCVCASV